MTTLFDPYTKGALSLKNRIAMAPMTRARAPDGIANAQTALYYRQRATAGLIVTEGTPISQEGTGFVFIPGIWSAAQVTGWRLVTQAVHEEGGQIFAQIWHVGRMSHTSMQPSGRRPVSSTRRPALDGTSRAFIIHEDGSSGFAPASAPRALETEEIGRVVRDYADAAANAMAAGFDGVEIHGANGYLIDQFLNPVVNDRSDRYGADTLSNRTRFVLEVVDAVVARIGAAKTAIRLSPFGTLFDIPAHPLTAITYLHLAQELSARGITYVHLADQHIGGSPNIPHEFLKQFRAAFTGTLILAGSMNKARADQLVAEGLIDLAAFGQPFIANPDLVERLRQGIPLNPSDRATYYGGDGKGYVDYPTHAQTSDLEAV